MDGTGSYLKCDVTQNNKTKAAEIKLELNSTNNDLKRKENYLNFTSRKLYKDGYSSFINWTKENKLGLSFTEATLLQYFNKLSQTLKPSTLWFKYSVLKATIFEHHGVDIKDYVRLKSFIKKKNASHKVKRSKVFTEQEVQTFLNEAPDHKYLVIKVALILGVCGGCRCKELVQIKKENIQKHGQLFLVKLPFKITSAPTDRSFLIPENLAPLIQKYVDLRPKNMETNKFFITYHSGKYMTKCGMGKNNFFSMPQIIAKYLNLPDPKQYTGHCFNLTSRKLRYNGGPVLAAVNISVRNETEIAEDESNYGINMEEMGLIDADELLTADLEENTTFTRNGDLSQQYSPTSAEITILKEEPPDEVDFNAPSTSNQSNPNQNNNCTLNNDPLDNDEQPEQLSDTNTDSDDDKPLAKIPKLPSEMFFITEMKARKADRKRDKERLKIERERLELERDRLRQRDAELQIQGKWLDLMKEGLRVLEKYLDKNRDTW